MRRIIVLCIALAFFGGTASAMTIPETGKAKETAVKAAYMKLPLSFVKNEGQKDKSVLFYERSGGHATAFTKEGAALYLGSSEAVILTPLTTSPFAVEATDKKEGKVNYFTGNDPSKWKTNIPTYGAILYKSIYPGIDMKFYGTNSQLEYDLIVSPEADPSKIRLSYKGIKKLSVTASGELEIALTEGSLYQKKPRVYQTINGKKVEIEGKFLIADATTYGFTLGAYDKRYPLVIDPILVYSTYLGGNSMDIGVGIAVDSSGCAYVTVQTGSTDFPTQVAYQGSRKGSPDAFVTKLSADGASLVYSTYLGGDSEDYAYAIAVDSSGHAYVTGETSSGDFPTQLAYQVSRKGDTDAFVTKLSADGASLVYSTYLGGGFSDYGHAIAVDSSGYAYVTGATSSTNFPTQGAYQGSRKGGGDAFVTKFGADGASLVYSTYLGGSDDETGYAIAVDSSGYAYVAGWTWSGDFPTRGAYQGSNRGNSDAFVTKLSADGASLVYSTYLGGSNIDTQSGVGIAVDSSGYAYVTGYTGSTNFPTRGAYQGSNRGSYDAFVTKLGIFTLSVSRAGTGSGTVTSDTGGIDCGSTCSAVLASGTEVTLTASASSGTFTGWSGACTGAGTCVVTMSADMTVTATFTLEFTVTASASGGNGTVSPATQTVLYGSSAAITITPDAGRHVSSILDAASSSTSRSVRKSAATTMSKAGASSTGTYVINNVTANHAVTVTFAADSAVLTATKTGNGTIAAAGLTCTGNTCSGTYSYGTPVSITATAGSGSAFTSWTGCDSTSSVMAGKAALPKAPVKALKAAASSSTCTVTMTGARTVTATFTGNQTLTATKNGTGTGTISGTGLTCTSNTCTGAYDYNASVTLAAAPATGSTFTGWNGCDSTLSNTCTVSMSAAKSVTATFTLATETLTATKTGNGTLSAAGLTCAGNTCSGTYSYNTPVTITATASSGSTCTSWTGCDSTSGTTCIVAMTSARSVTATFTGNQTLTATKNGTGTGALSATGLTCAGNTCTGSYPYSSPVTITAAAATGSALTGWTGCDSSSGNTCIVTMTSARSVTATFTLSGETLTVTKTGTGTGTLSATGLTCAGSTCTGSYPYGSPVIITAAAGSDSTFTSFSNCDTVSGTTCTVNMTSPRNVTAAFSAPCTYTVSPSWKSFTSKGGSIRVTVKATGMNCASPTISVSDPWITAVMGDFRNNRGTLAVTASPIDSITDRTGTVIIHTGTFTITQTGAACNLSFISPAGDTFAPEGGSHSLNVTTLTGCGWNVTSSALWLTPVTTSGTGGGVVSYTASANATGKQRTGKLTVALSDRPSVKKAFTVRQSPCTISISPASDSFGNSGGSDSFTVTAPSGCGWNVEAGSIESSWLSATPASSSGSGPVSYTALGNGTNKQRTGKLTIFLTDTPTAKKVFTVIERK